jgi:hypothetical protein
MRTNKPVDLGVNYTAEDFRNLQRKTNLEVSNFDKTHGTPQDIDQVDPGVQLVMLGANTTEVTVTQEELTALLNMMPWTASPLSNSQLRISDGTFEFSGNIKSAYVSDLIRTIYPTTDYEQLNPILKLAGHLYNPAVYLKANISSANVTGGPSHGQLTMKIIALRVNHMDLADQVASMNELKVTVPEGSHEQGIAYSLSSLVASAGNVKLYGTMPSALSVGGGTPDVLCENIHGSSLVSLNAVNGRIGSTLKYCQ